MLKILLCCISLMLLADCGIADSKKDESHSRSNWRLSCDEFLMSGFARIEKKLDMLSAMILTKPPKEHPHKPETSNHVKIAPSDCADVLVKTHKSGIYSIQCDSYGPTPFLVYCDATTQDGNWTVIQRRKDGSVNFFRNWADYKRGFGNLDGEFFIGMDKLHALTMDKPQELLIVMEDFENNVRFAKYDAFAINNEEGAYALILLGKYSGDAGDSLREHASQKFSTMDRDNDAYSGNCASQFKGAWWYEQCHSSNLNGLYLKGEYSVDKYAQGVAWKSWRGYYYSLKSVDMLIRPKSN